MGLRLGGPLALAGESAEQAQTRVAHYRPADTTPPVGLINGEATKHSDGAWVRQITPETTSCILLYRTGGNA